MEITRLKLVVVVFVFALLGWAKAYNNDNGNDDKGKDDKSGSFALDDLVDGVDLSKVSFTPSDDIAADDQPGNPLDPDDFNHASDPAYDMPALDESTIEENDPILMADAFEGDITNVHKKDLEQQMSAARQSNVSSLLRNAIKDPWRKWPKGQVPYVISKEYNSKDRAVIAKAIKQYHDKTCIKFVPRKSEKAYVHIVKGQGCSSSVGKTGKVQSVSLGRGCVFEGIAIHELMHAIGFWHEQSRADRDDHVKINRQNIIPQNEFNFMKYSLNKISHLNADYDTCSVMHYSAYAFSKNKKKTIEVKKKGKCELGQRKGFSEIDLQKINTLYECKGKKQTSGKGNKKKTTTYRIPTEENQCKDLHRFCATWAKTGECQTNPSWMLKNCQISCRECKNLCGDFNPVCSRWAARGECQRNKEYMDIYCVKSCGKCLSQGGDCKDEIKASDCKKFKRNGYCQRGQFVDYMKLKCKKTCQTCRP